MFEEFQSRQSVLCALRVRVVEDAVQNSRGRGLDISRLSINRATSASIRLNVSSGKHFRFRLSGLADHKDDLVFAKISSRL